MAEKDANNSSNSIKNQNGDESPNGNGEDTNELCAGTGDQNKITENDSYDMDTSMTSFESPFKREENPFSFKKFLNQDSSSQKDKGARKKVYPTANVTTSNKSNELDHSLGRNQADMSPRVISATDVSSVLPDFVQDHLVIEQCYLSGSSSINIDNLNLQNLPDLNLEHQNVHFGMNSTRDSNQMQQNQFSNLPDFTLGARNYSSGINESYNSDTLPDFTLGVKSSASADADWASNSTSLHVPMRRVPNQNQSNEASQSNRSRAQLSSSPSLSLDLPAYENSNQSNHNVSIPFDLTMPADDKSCSDRGSSTAPETVSKSLPDFLSDGPIKKELDENFKCSRKNTPSVPNGICFSENRMVRMEHERLIREIESLRCQLSDRNRRLEMLESELEHLHSTDQRETASLEYAFKEVESNLKQTTKRAINAEDMVLKLKQENKMLKSEVCSLRSENMELRLGNCDLQGPSSQERKNQRLAKELRTAANIAETSLRSLLGGIDNLRVIASSLENIHKFQDNCEDYEGFLKEDSASGPAL